MAYELSEMKKVGIGLLGCGILFTFLGVILFFDRGLLALGNIFCLSGVAFLLGWQSMWRLFTNKINFKLLLTSGIYIDLLIASLCSITRQMGEGSIAFFVGLFLIFVRWPIAGIILQIYGSIALFSGFWPSVKVFLYQIPVMGWLLQYPFFFFDRLKQLVS